MKTILFLSCNSMQYCLLPLALLTFGCKRESTPAAATAAAPQPTATVAAKEPPPASESARDPHEVVARVDNATLSWSDMEKRARTLYMDESRTMLIPEGKAEQAMDFFRRRAVTIFVFKTIMLEEAVKQKIELSAKDKQEGTNRMERVVERLRGVTLDTFFKESLLGEEGVIQDFNDGMLIDKLLKVEVISKINVTEDDLNALVKEIIVERAEKKKKIDELRAKLVAGADFAALAAEFSEHESKKMGGDLGQITRGKIFPSLEEAIFKLPIGEISPVIESPLGLHLVKVTARHAAKEASANTPAIPESAQASHILIKARPVQSRMKLEDEVRNVKRTEAIAAYYKQLKEGRRIESIFPDLVL